MHICGLNVEVSYCYVPKLAYIWMVMHGLCVEYMYVSEDICVNRCIYMWVSLRIYVCWCMNESINSKRVPNGIPMYMRMRLRMLNTKISTHD